jgi:arylsulfatase A-like enzyme
MHDRPNILFIMSDDHAYQAMGCYGSKINATPNMDRIANEGVRFDHCYVTNSICTPSRAAILTGTYNHVNRVTTLSTHIDNRLPNVAKHLRTGGYQTAIIGKWHLGQGPEHWPTGFDFWSVLPGQGIYHDPVMFEMGQRIVAPGYVTDVTTDKCIDWLDHRDAAKPFFLMCHHKAPHRPWDPKPEHRTLYNNPIDTPTTFDDDYSNRAHAAAEAKMRVSEDLTYRDLDLVQLPESPGGEQAWGDNKRVPFPDDVRDLRLRCQITGEEFSFTTREELKRFKYQRYLRKYLQCVHSIDENVGRLLDYLDREGLAENTVVIYTSDQGFYLGEHGWFDKRFIYEESFRMPFIVRYPAKISPGSVCDSMACNVDFAPTFLELAGLPVPNYMQGRSIVPLLEGSTPDDWTDVAYHRYWMNQDDSHNAYAHYGIRTHRYKLIYWYNEDCGEPGAHPGTDHPEWELFDLETDPLELKNVYDDPAYAAVVTMMTARLDAEMARIGDTPLH